MKISALAAMAALVMLAACSDSDGPAENLGERIDDAMGEAQDRLEDAGDEAREAADEIEDALRGN